ncbi:MAG: aminoacetone oxidase family FAD-binding enzyme [Gemmatimonadetes bacterium]|nr:aminoacetone oxidase family FAD-binding enzyme [Gemmatimonadota bacterium]
MPVPTLPRTPIVVVGAGAAGLVAALFAARSGGDVVLVEGTKDGGRKILISGGGRCNILPSEAAPRRYVTDSSPNSLRKMLRSWPLQEQIDFFEGELGLRLVREEETGKLFPETNRARDVRDGLVARVREAGARIWFGTRVTDIRPGDAGQVVSFDVAPDLVASAVILATGGLSVPATGSDGVGLSIAERLGHRVHPTYPALTPLTADPTPHAGLAGISLRVGIRAPGTKPGFSTHDGFLFTHRGWSGPAVLDASHLAIRGRSDGSRQPLEIQWTESDAAHWDRALQDGKGTVRSCLAGELPRRLAEQLCGEAEIPVDASLATLRREDRRRLVDLLTRYDLPWTGDEGYKKAEVTGGGVALSEVDPVTMESRRAPGIFLCGEILDAFGPIGGHNFLWAWATGRAAGVAAGSGAGP